MKWNIEVRNRNQGRGKPIPSINFSITPNKNDRIVKNK